MMRTIVFTARGTHPRLKHPDAPQTLLFVCMAGMTTGDVICALPDSRLSEMTAWCSTCVGSNLTEWTTSSPRTFFFIHQHDAVAFKLRWQGDVLVPFP